MKDCDYRLFFSTFTNLNWIKVLDDDRCKGIILDSLEFMVINKRARIYAYVIMPNHIHLIWWIEEDHSLPEVQRDFLKFTAQHIKYHLVAQKSPLLGHLSVKASDRKIQIWQKHGYSFPLFKPKTILQKLNYIHRNPVRNKWYLAKSPEDYRFSSAAFYENGVNELGILTHIHEVLW